MSPKSFCFWLQGAFELGSLVELSADRVAMVRNHLLLVFACRVEDEEQDPPQDHVDAFMFCLWFMGWIAASGPGAMSREKTKLVRAKLDGLFEHAIDPTMPGNPVKLQQLHDGTLQVGKNRC